MEGSIEKPMGNIGPVHVTLTCMSPNARDLLERIMDAYCEKHKITHDDTRLFSDPPSGISIYGFAYWLCRHSGLVEPSPGKGGPS